MTRPVLEVPRSGAERVMEAVALLGVVATVLLTACYWSLLPGRVPHHFDFVGRPDVWGDKIVLLTVPVISLIVYVGLSILSRVPHRFNYAQPITPDNAQMQYRLARQLVVNIKAIIVWSFGWILWGAVRTALGEMSGLGTAFLPIMLAAIAGAFVVYIVSVRRSIER